MSISLYDPNNKADIPHYTPGFLGVPSQADSYSDSTTTVAVNELATNELNTEKPTSSEKNISSRFCGKLSSDTAVRLMLTAIITSIYIPLVVLGSLTVPLVIIPFTVLYLICLSAFYVK